MNFTYTLSPDEIQRQLGQRPPAPGLRWWVNRVESVFSGILVALYVIVRFPALTGVVALVVGTVAIAILVRALFSRFRIAIGSANNPVEVTISTATISTMRGSETTTHRWATLQGFTVDVDGFMVAFIDGTRRWVPDRAFANASEREAFLAFVVEHAPQSVGFPLESRVAAAERPIVALTSGTWRWSIEHTDAARATLWLEDPADDRNNVSATIDDEWVEWTAERLDAAISVPTRRDFADDDVTWRIDFPTKNVAEAHTVNRPEHLPTIPGLMWVLADGVAPQHAGLPWAGMARATTEELREWFEEERAATARPVSHQR